MEDLIISSGMEDNNKTWNKNKEKPLPGKLASFTPIIVSVFDNTWNIKCKHPNIDAILGCSTYQKMLPLM